MPLRSSWLTGVVSRSCSSEIGDFKLLGIFLLTLAFLVPVAGSQAYAQDCISVTPISRHKNFGTYAVGTTTLISEVTLTNNCSTNITIDSISIDAPEFLVVYGWAPIVKTKKSIWTLGLRFAPDAAGTFNGTLTINVDGYDPIIITLTGTGYATKAAATVSTNMLAFNSTTIGSTTAPQSVSITNTGTGNFTVKSVYTDAPFAVTGFSGNTLLSPGSSLPLQVTFTPSQPQAYNGTLVFTSDQLPPGGVTLSGTGVPAKSLAVTTFPELQYATQGYAYHEELNAARAVKPLQWSLASGATLPQGLSLSSRGVISGTLASSVPAGNYSFTVNVTDSSSPPSTATALLSIPVGPPSGAACQNIDWLAADTSTPLTPLPDLGTGTYFGVQGGLYLDGSNVMPASHEADGVSYAQAVQPLDGSGNPDPNGKYALLSIGMSTTFDTFLQFMQDAKAEPKVNSHLVFVPGAMPNAKSSDWADPNFGGWVNIMNFFLPQQGVTANQVVAAWVSDTDSGITGTFPDDMTAVQAELELIAQNLHSKFPNLTMAFYNSRFYGGYSNGLPSPSSPEPYAYESGFAVRGVITDQLNGVPAMNYNPANGPVMAPWVAWADYDWANGLLLRKDGFAWSCQDFNTSGIHNSNPPGREKDTNQLLNFFRTSDTTAPWFLTPSTRQKPSVSGTNAKSP